MDLQVAASGGGYGHTECPQGIPVEFALLSILAAFGVAFGVLFMALTQQTMGRRRRRSTGDGVDDDDGEEEAGLGGDLAFKFGDILWAGEKVDKIHILNHKCMRASTKWPVYVFTRCNQSFSHRPRAPCKVTIILVLERANVGSQSHVNYPRYDMVLRSTS